MFLFTCGRRVTLRQYSLSTKEPFLQELGFFFSWHFIKTTRFLIHRFEISIYRIHFKILITGFILRWLGTNPVSFAVSVILGISLM